MTLRVLENFAGIGTQRMALENLGIDHEVVGITEIDKFAIKSYEAVHGETNNLGDISLVDSNDVPDHDLFTYSFPCQDISIAGKGKGFEKGAGTRSGLLWECEEVIRAKKPKYLLMENVKNLVSKKFKPGFEEWLTALEELGYTNYVEVLNAKDYGIPQNRERVFCVSILGEHEPYEFPEKETLELRLKDILEDEVDEKFYLSEELHNRFSYKGNFKNDIKLLGTTNPNATIGQRDIVYSSEGISGALTATDYKRPKQIGEITGWSRKDMSRVYSKDGVSPTLTTMQGGYTEPKVLIKNNTKQGYIEATDGDGVDLAFPNSNTRRGRVQKGKSQTLDTSDSKGVVVEEVKRLAKQSRPNDEIGVTVKPNGDMRTHKMDAKKSGVQELAITHEGNPSNTVTPTHAPKVYGDSTNLRIRKLTPKECWRLMGISDDDFEKAQEVNSNTQLYKQAGNAIVVDVLEAIFANMFKQEELK